MIGVFVSLDLFLFYVFWDAMLIPMYFLIGIWGDDQRIYARHQVRPLHDGRQLLMLVAILVSSICTASATGSYVVRPR